MTCLRLCEQPAKTSSARTQSQGFCSNQRQIKLELELHPQLDLTWVPGAGDFAIARVVLISATSAAKSRAAVGIGKAVAANVDP
jgi:hypothetical protein